MVYLILKELANTAEDVIMSTSIIMKDTAVGSDVLYRANAIRALCRIIDVRTWYIILLTRPSNRKFAGYYRPRH